MATSSQNTHKLYDKLAWLWPLLSPPGDYADEADGVHELIYERLGKPARTANGEHDIATERSLLELGSGGGHMLLHLQQWYDVTGSDLSESMLELSSTLNPLVTHYQADMRTLRLEQLFDVVLIHDALGYMVTSDDLTQAIATAAVHLKPGGVLLLLPDEIAETFSDQQSASDSMTTDDGKEITLVSHAAYSDGASETDDVSSYALTMLFLIRQGGKLRIEEDRHRCGLFSRKAWRDVLKQNGFEKISVQKQTEWRGSPVLIAQKTSK